MTKTKPFLSTCYGDPSAIEVPPCFEEATRKFTFSTTSVLLLLDVPLSLSRGTIFRRQKNPRRGYRPKIAGILFVCNEPGRSIPYCAQLRRIHAGSREPLRPLSDNPNAHSLFFSQTHCYAVNFVAKQSSLRNIYTHKCTLPFSN